MRTRPRRYAVLLAGAAVVALSGCGGSSDPQSAASAPTAASSNAKPGSQQSAKPSPKSTAKVTTSTLGVMPPVVSSGPSKVDSASVGSAADLPAAFQCPASIAPIQLPATPTSPAGVVCASKLADDEALYLWYVGNPDERYLALQTALAKAKYVHGGSTWVAGGMLDASMGDVGGDVYK
ncbi:MAG: hypothetical protein ACOYBY_03295 [Dermatophilaceae bacterium]